MNKLKLFFKKNAINILYILASIPLIMLIIYIIYDLFSSGLPEEIHRIDPFSVFIGIFITGGIQAIIETRKESKRNGRNKQK